MKIEKMEVVQTYLVVMVILIQKFRFGNTLCVNFMNIVYLMEYIQ